MTYYNKSVFIEYNATKDGTTGLDFGARDGTLNLTQTIMLDPNKRKSYRIVRVRLSPVYVNIYNYNGVNNTDVNISNDGGATWVTVHFKNGNYSELAMIQEGINDVVNQLGWYKSSTDPGIIINSNPATSYAYTKLDSTKLNAGQLAIDWTANGTSTLYQLMGYNQASAIFLVDGIFTGNNPPQVDSQGTYVRIYCSVIQNTRLKRNGSNQLVSDNSICTVPFITDTNAVEIVYPGNSTGTVSPVIGCSASSIISSIGFSFKNTNGSPFLWNYGEVSVELEIFDE